MSMTSMDPESAFRQLHPGSGTNELTGAADLLAHFKLREDFAKYCERTLPESIAESRYLSRVVGGTEFRRGPGLELGQLITAPDFWDSLEHEDIRPLDQDTLSAAFTFKETGPVVLPQEEKGLPTISGPTGERHKKHREKDRDKKDRDKEKDGKDRDKKHKRKHKKHKHRHKDKGEVPENSEDAGRKHKKDKKRKRDGEEGKDGGNEKREKKKHKHSSKNAMNGT